MLKGIISAVLATLFWSGNLIIARGLNEQIPPVGFAFWRWVIAIILLTPFALPLLLEKRALLLRHKYFITISALFGVTVFNTFLYIASETISAINLSLISVSLPVFILIISHIWLKEPFNMKNTIGISVAMAGILLLISKGNWSELLQLDGQQPGNYWMLAATVSFALYSVMLKRKPAEISATLYLYSSFIIGLVLLSPFYLWEHLHVEVVRFSWITLPAFLYVGLFASILSYFLWNQSIYLLGPSKAAPMYYLIAVFSTLGAWVLLNESITVIHLISMALIITGIIVTNLKFSTTPKSADSD